MNTLNHYFAESIQNYNDKVLFLQPATGESLTFSEFEAALRKAHHVLQQNGVSRGDVVTLIGGNGIDLAVMIYGTITFGAIAKPLNPQVTARELEKLLLHSGSKVIFADRRIAVSQYGGRYLELDAYRRASDEALSVPAPEHEDSPALLIYTSGTTSQPKGVMLSHHNIAHNVVTAIRTFELGAGHTTICLLPLFHTFGFISDLSTMAFCGGTTVILDTFDVTKLPLIEDAIHKYAVNSFSAVPLMFELFLRFGCNLSGKHMKFCVSGAAPLRENTAAEFLATYKFPIIPAYGLTETTCFATISPPAKIKPRSAGIPATVTARVTRDDGEEAGAGEIGELLLAGESVMQQGYFRSEIDCFYGDDQKWFKTGDLGYRDEEGYIYITGRKKNMVIRGGEKIYLEDLNVCLAEMKPLADSASIRMEEDGEDKILTFAVTHEGARVTELEIKNFIEKQLGRLRVPDAVVFTSSIPRTSTNKIKIRELQELSRTAKSATSV